MDCELKDWHFPDSRVGTMQLRMLAYFKHVIEMRYNGQLVYYVIAFTFKRGAVGEFDLHNSFSYFMYVNTNCVALKRDPH